MKPIIRKLNGRWQVSRPGYGFGLPSVDVFDSWKSAVGSLRTAPASAGSLTEHGHYSLGLSYQDHSYQRGTIRLEDT